VAFWARIGPALTWRMEIKGMDDVRPATRGDRETVTASVAAAFAHDPAWLFLLEPDYDRLAPLFAGILFDVRVDAGNVWITGDGAAAAMWDPPATGSEPWSPSEDVWAPFRAQAGEAAWQRLAEYERAVDAARPSTPYWYLGVLAAHPDRQRSGLASAVMAPILGIADGDGIACCLETSTAGNKTFYERRGFTEATDVHITGGPPTWWLRRPRP
jgi:GNAT superfamily N-acetyltransferase